MTIRDFSQEKYNNLVDALDDIQSKHQSKLEDAVEGYLFKAANHLEIYDTEMILEKKIDHYQKHMMDAYNTTKTDLQNIFDSVQGVDKEYGDVFEEFAETFSQAKQSIQALTEHIDHIDDASALQALITKLNNINEKMDLADTKVTESFDKALDYQMEYLTYQSRKGMIKHGISLVGDIFSFCGSALKGDIPGQIDKIWSACNDYIDLCSDTSVAANAATTTLAIGLIQGGSWVGGKLFGLDPIDFQYQDFKNRQVQLMTEEWEKEDGVSGQVESFSGNPTGDVFYRISKGVDILQDSYELVDGIKNIGKDIFEGKNFLTKLDEFVNPSIPDALEGNAKLIDRYTKIKRISNLTKILEDGSAPMMDTLFKKDEDSWAGFIQDQLEEYTHSGGLIKKSKDVADYGEDIQDFFDVGSGD